MVLLVRDHGNLNHRRPLSVGARALGMRKLLELETEGKRDKYFDFPFLPSWSLPSSLASAGRQLTQEPGKHSCREEG